MSTSLSQKILLSWHDPVFNTFHATDLLIPPENIRKPEAFWCFQGVSKEISGMKCFNGVEIVSCILVIRSTINFLTAGNCSLDVVYCRNLEKLYPCMKSVQTRSFFWSVFPAFQKKLRIWTLFTQCIGVSFFLKLQIQMLFSNLNCDKTKCFQHKAMTGN